MEVLKSATHKIGYQVVLKFSISQHTRDVELLKRFIQFLDCGLLKERSNISEFVVVKLADIQEKLIPLFVRSKKCPIQGLKNLNYLDFCEIAELMSNKAHLTKQGLEKIIGIKSRMNAKTTQNFLNG